MTKKDLIDAIYSELNRGCDKKTVKATRETINEIYNLIFGNIVATIELGNSYCVRDFGTFEKTKRASVTKYIPGTGKTMEVPERFTVTFKASDSLKKQVNRLGPDF